VLPLLNILMTVLAVIYFAHWIGLALYANLSISGTDFFLLQSPIKVIWVSSLHGIKFAYLSKN